LTEFAGISQTTATQQMMHLGAPSDPTGNDASIGVLKQSMSPKKMALKRFVNHRAALLSTIVLVMIIIFVAPAPITTRYGVNETIFPASEGPNQNLAPFDLAWFGTDGNGRDLYSRIIFGAQVSMLIGLFTATSSSRSRRSCSRSRSSPRSGRASSTRCSRWPSSSSPPSRAWCGRR